MEREKGAGAMSILASPWKGLFWLQLIPSPSKKRIKHPVAQQERILFLHMGHFSLFDFLQNLFRMDLGRNNGSYFFGGQPQSDCYPIENRLGPGWASWNVKGNRDDLVQAPQGGITVKPQPSS